MNTEALITTTETKITLLRNYEACDIARDNGGAVIKAEAWVKAQGQETLMFTHFFNEKGEEVGLFTDCMNEYAVLTLFHTPRQWHESIMKTLKKWRVL